MVRYEVDGVVGTTEVSITITGDDETVANLIYADLSGRCEMLTEVVELRRHPDAAEAGISADWEAWLNGEIPRDAEGDHE